MIQVEFQGEVQRLIKRFGARAFDEEFNVLLWKAVCDMEVRWFSKIVDTFIGNLRQSPLIKDFQEVAYKERKRQFDQEVSQTAMKWEIGEFKGLGKYLDSIGAQDLNHAIAMEIAFEEQMLGEKK